MSRAISLAQLQEWLLRFADRIDERAAYLTELDAAIGDADHGANMMRGMGKVRQRLAESGEPPADAPALFRTVAMTLISSVGGAAGPLYGAFFMRASREPAGSEPAGSEPAGSENGAGAVSVGQLAAMFRAGVEGVQQRGKAEIDEKTMLDVLQPAVAALEAAVAAGAAPAEALAAARAAAEQGMRHTVDLEASKGRASYLGHRSVGHQDPGATSSYYLFETLAQVIGGSSA